MPDDRFFGSPEPPRSAHSAELEFIMEQFVRIPTRTEIVRAAMWVAVAPGVLGVLVIGTFWPVAACHGP
jgi:hypothetical protein